MKHQCSNDRWVHSVPHVCCAKFVLGLPDVTVRDVPGTGVIDHDGLEQCTRAVRAARFEQGEQWPNSAKSLVNGQVRAIGQSVERLQPVVERIQVNRLGREHPIDELNDEGSARFKILAAETETSHLERRTLRPSEGGRRLTDCELCQLCSRPRD